MADTRTYSFWAMVYPAPDIPGQWVAHCLNLDLISQGDSAMQAARNACEASCIVVEDDLGQGLDPLTRSAPEEDWTRFYHLVEKATSMPVSDIESEGKTMLFPFEVLAVATQVTGQNGRSNDTAQAA